MPTDIRFYHLTDTPLERALPQLLEKAYGGKFRTLVKTADAESAKAMDSLLWAYDEASFLPHGLATDKAAAEHPILITFTHENTHGATLLAVTDGSLTPPPNPTSACSTSSTRATERPPANAGKPIRMRVTSCSIGSRPMQGGRRKRNKTVI